MTFPLGSNIFRSYNSSQPEEIGSDLFQELFSDLNNLTYQIGGWSVANEEPWRRELMGNSKLSIFQGRFNMNSFGSECQNRGNINIPCINRFELGKVFVELPNLDRDYLLPNVIVRALHKIKNKNHNISNLILFSNFKLYIKLHME